MTELESKKRHWYARELVLIGVFAAAAKLSSLLIALAGGGMNPVSLIAKNLVYTTLVIVLLTKVPKPGTLLLFTLISMIVSICLLGGSLTLLPAAFAGAMAGEIFMWLTGGTKRLWAPWVGVAVYDDIRPCTIRVRVSGDGVKYLRTLPLHASQQEVETRDDYAIFEFHVAPTPEFYQAMLNCHGNFEVLSPGHVREEMRRIIGDLGALYAHNVPKVIFLDFDGVMNTERYIAERRRNGLPVSDRYGYLFDPEAVENLRRIIDATGAAVVISSSWRLEGEERMEAMWYERTLPGQLIGVTGQSPHANFPMSAGETAGAAKGEEIRGWLKEHVLKPYRYVIFDDEADIRPEQRPHFIQTDPRIGITRADAERAIQILNGEDHD